MFSIYDTRIRRPLHTNTRTTPKQIQVTTNHNNKVIFPQLNINIHPATGKSATAIATSQTLLRNIRLSVLFTAPQTKLFFHKVTTKKRNAERYSDRIELQGFQSCFRLFVKPSQSPLKPNQDAATLLVRNHARNGDKRTRITKQGVKD